MKRLRASKHLSAASRADLLRCLDAPEGLGEAAAAIFGFGREQDTPKPKPPPPGDDDSAAPGGGKALQRGGQDDFPTEYPRLSFLMPTEAETLAKEPPPPPGPEPIRDDELAVDWAFPEPPLPPLAPWARLAPYLRGRLGRRVPGERLDLRRLTRRIARGEPLHSLPHLPRTTWAAQALVLRDITPEMDPFQKDIRFLLGRLRRERGRHGLVVRLVRGLPGPGLLAGVPAGIPVLALSAMGQFQGSRDVAAAWEALARRLAFRGHPFYALAPCPRDRWRAALAAAWPAAVWDRRPRLPRHGGLRRIAGDGMAEAPDPATKRLLDLLAPASRIEPPLLRETRLRLGPDADAGTEWDAWHHEECWSSPECFGFRTGEAYEARLDRRKALAGAEAELAREIGALVSQHHEMCSVVIAAEADLRACLTGGADGEKLKRAEVLLQRVVERLRLLAAEPGGAEGRRSGLAAWFEAMVTRLSPEIRRNPGVSEMLARGQALADVFLKTSSRRLAAGLDPLAYMAGRRETGPAPAGARDYRVVLLAKDPIAKDLQVVPGGSAPAGREHPLALLRVGGDVALLSLRAEGTQQTVNHKLQFSSPVPQPSIPALGAPAPLTIESDLQRLVFATVPRPDWARRMFYDRFGIAADFEVGGVLFVMRWIPPGRFFMGSPEDKPKRWDTEVPRHEVTISRGFWLGETPVTQAQWRAVAEAAKGKNALDPEPSHFEGGERPVEQVSWRESVAFAQGLGEAFPGLHPGLPTEAQWEYACRAGTRGAFHDGSPCTKPTGKDPALDRLGWFDENSEANTHKVKRKAPNNWGLHDMHGNVWEWCADAWDREAYRKRKNGAKDPKVESDKNDADRVVRGGAWGGQAEDCRAAFRGGFEPGNRGLFLGLRLAAGQESGAAEPPGAERPGKG